MERRRRRKEEGRLNLHYKSDPPWGAADRTRLSKSRSPHLPPPLMPPPPFLFLFHSIFLLLLLRRVISFPCEPSTCNSTCMYRLADYVRKWKETRQQPNKLMLDFFSFLCCHPIGGLVEQSECHKLRKAQFTVRALNI